jgi:CRP-like cAMP-binding protein
MGAASSALANLDADAQERASRLDRALAFMRARKVPTFFQKIIVDYYKHLWGAPSLASDAVLEDLPPTLRARLAMIANRDLIEQFPLLVRHAPLTATRARAHLPPHSHSHSLAHSPTRSLARPRAQALLPADVYLSLIQRLPTATFLPGEYIARQGQAGDCLFLLKRGKVDAVLPNGVTVFASHKPGDFFGEHCLLSPLATLRDASFRAVDFVDVLVLQVRERAAERAARRAAPRNALGAARRSLAQPPHHPSPALLAPCPRPRPRPRPRPSRPVASRPFPSPPRSAATSRSSTRRARNSSTPCSEST